ncbi:MAG: AAA family ATPase [Planctomycetota bacterium]|nr:MAG: AAA family ATPase [Planctomycetota bacterium]
MSDVTLDNLLARLAGHGKGSSDDPWSSLAAATPQHTRETEVPKKKAGGDGVDGVLDRLNSLAGGTPKKSPRATIDPNGFLPIEPETFLDAELTDSQVEALILKYLLARGDASGRDIADQIKLPFRPVEELLRQMKQDQLVGHRGAAPMNDYVFQLSELGRERARRLSEICTYYGAAPVALQDYIESVAAQSLVNQHPTREDLTAAFHDLLINPRMMSRLGPAINSGRGLFLYGAPGNGKTSIAERVTRAFGKYIWVPRAIGVDGDIIRLYDPCNHELAPEEEQIGLLDHSKIDKRWVRIARPTIVVGGELTMDNLEISLSIGTGISEAPLQLKSNCGTLVIDDFGRQRMSTDELLNRWIVPLEKRYDYLNLPGGKKIQVPFDQLIIFSTNLEPKDLVDDAFLRRIPYKIEVVDPALDEFENLFKLVAPKMGIEFKPDVFEHLVERHYRRTGRPMRCCHPRDLLLQVKNFCNFNGIAAEMTNDTMDFAVENYFTIME